jgi:spermidine/putrescine transport system ATP-binding protein
MENTFAVELQDVVKKFGGVTAVNHVTVHIKDGEFFSLLGPSGCGKTTTLRMIAGFEMPTSGEVMIGGDYQGYLPAFKRPVNTVFQQYALFPHMTIYQNVAFGLEMKKVPKEETKKRVSESLDMVHLTGMDNRLPKQLSGGQQQRVALARALVNKPKVLLLDEPLGALDLKLRKAMQVELKALQHQVGITFIYVTHDQEEALTMSDRIAVMHNGKLLQVGTPLEIYESPESRFVSDFIGETNYLFGVVSSADGKRVNVKINPELTIKAESHKQLSEGQHVSVALRPEKVRLNVEAGDQDNNILADVIDVIFMGSSVIYHLMLPGQVEMQVRQQNVETFTEKGIKKGSQVRLVWPVRFSKAFPTEED